MSALNNGSIGCEESERHRRVRQIVDLRLATGYQDVRGRSGANTREWTIRTSPPAPTVPVNSGRIHGGFRRNFTSGNHLLAPLWVRVEIPPPPPVS